jgi:hypothetical protein
VRVDVIIFKLARGALRLAFGGARALLGVDPIGSGSPLPRVLARTCSLPGEPGQEFEICLCMGVG